MNSAVMKRQTFFGKLWQAFGKASEFLHPSPDLTAIFTKNLQLPATYNLLVCNNFEGKIAIFDIFSCDQQLV